MNESTNQPSPKKLLNWFNPLGGRHMEGWGFTLNRITALGLTLYLFLHLIVLGTLAQGPNAYQGFLDLIHNPIFVFGEFLVVLAVLIHGLNGIRIVLTSLGIAVPQQKSMLVVFMALAVIAGIIFAVKMFTAG